MQLQDCDFDPDPSTVRGLRDLIEIQMHTVTAVVTGSPMEEYAAVYRHRREQIRSALSRRGLEDPFWFDLNLARAWAKNWPTYAERREEIAKRIGPLIDKLADLENLDDVDVAGSGPVGWPHIDVRMQELRVEIATATSLDELQDVGRRSREVLKAAVKFVYSPDMADGRDQPKGDDVTTQFELLLKSRSHGLTHETLLAFMRKTWRLANSSTHANITRVDAFAAAGAALLLVRILAEIRRETEARRAEF